MSGPDLMNSDFVDPDPLTRFRRWLPAEFADNTAFAPMTLSTVGLDGYPEGRTVLLSEFDDAGFCFHTDANSAKVAQLRENPRACLTLLWPADSHQVVIQGDVAPLEPAIAARAYASRSRYLQLLAWLNSAEHAQLALPERQKSFAGLDASAQAGDGCLSPPATWVGFRLVPLRMVFWQGVSDATSQRLQYRAHDGGWTHALLPG